MSTQAEELLVAVQQLQRISIERRERDLRSGVINLRDAKLQILDPGNSSVRQLIEAKPIILIERESMGSGELLQSLFVKQRGWSQGLDNSRRLVREERIGIVVLEHLPTDLGGHVAVFAASYFLSEDTDGDGIETGEFEEERRLQLELPLPAP